MVQKVCFITIGATAAFDQLLEATLSREFLHALASLEYTNLLLQYGKNGQKILERLNLSIGPGKINRHGIEIIGFDFNTKGLAQEMWCTKAAKDRAEGVVISHAGMLQTLWASKWVKASYSLSNFQALAPFSTRCVFGSRSL